MWPARLRIEFRAPCASCVAGCRRTSPFGRLLQRPGAEAIEKLRIDFAYARDHLADHLRALQRACRKRPACATGGAARCRKACAPWWWRRPRAKRSGRLRWRVFRPAARLYRSRLACDIGPSAKYRPRIPRASSLQQRGEFAIGVPGARDGALEDISLGAGQNSGLGRNVGDRRGRGARSAGSAARNCKTDARAETTRQIGGLRFRGRIRNARAGKRCDGRRKM